MLSALSFLTILGGARPPERGALGWFPLIGAGIGAVLAAVWWAAQLVWTPGVAAVVLISADLVVTGLLHFDGLADCADGLLPHLERKRRLEVMRAPDVGAFALAVVTTVLLGRWAALASGQVQALSLIGVWATSRTVVAVVPSLVSYARPEGIATSFIDGSRRVVVWWLLPVAALLFVAQGWVGVVAMLWALAVATGVVILAVRRIGGFTGDVLGAVIVLSETAALLALAVRG